MQPTPTPPTGAPHRAIPSQTTSEPAGVTANGSRNPARALLTRVMSTLHGDKYMVGAYPPDWPPAKGTTTQTKER